MLLIQISKERYLAYARRTMSMLLNRGRCLPLSVNLLNVNQINLIAAALDLAHDDSQAARMGI